MPRDRRAPDSSQRTAVLLSCHGSVERLEDVAAFVRNIRHGRPAPDEVVAEVTRRYRLIGGSPLMRITREQAQALEERLGVPVRAAARLWHPYPAEVLGELAAAGVDTVVSLPLAPQSVHVYHAAVRKAAEPLGIALLEAPSYGTEPALVGAFVEAIAEARARIVEQGAVALVLTAHSLPRRVIDAGDPYARDFEAMAEAVSAALPPAFSETRVAFQSQGMDGGQWLGPDVESTLDELAGAGAAHLVIAPIGFVADHVETLYDVDVELAARARALGFRRIERMPPMNTRPSFVGALEIVARRLLAARA